MLGATEYVAEACEEQLNSLDHQTHLHLNPKFSSILQASFPKDHSQKDHSKVNWLVCTSTHGAGDFPDNIQSFVEDLKKCEQDLSSISFMIIAMGDSNYDTFCQAAINIENLLIIKGCTKMMANKTLDMSLDIDPEDLASLWIKENSDLL